MFVIGVGALIRVSTEHGLIRRKSIEPTWVGKGISRHSHYFAFEKVDSDTFVTLQRLTPKQW
jgi:hypothetical protein